MMATGFGSKHLLVLFFLTFLEMALAVPAGHGTDDPLDNPSTCAVEGTEWERFSGTQSLGKIKFDPLGRILPPGDAMANDEVLGWSSLWECQNGQLTLSWKTRKQRYPNEVERCAVNAKRSAMICVSLIDDTRWTVAVSTGISGTPSPAEYSFLENLTFRQLVDNSEEDLLFRAPNATSPAISATSTYVGDRQFRIRWSSTRTDECVLDPKGARYLCMNGTTRIIGTLNPNQTPPASLNSCATLDGATFEHRGDQGTLIATLVFSVDATLYSSNPADGPKLATGGTMNGKPGYRWTCENGLLNLAWTLADGSEHGDRCELNAKGTAYACRNEAGHFVYGSLTQGRAALATFLANPPDFGAGSCKDFEGATFLHKNMQTSVVTPLEFRVGGKTDRTSTTWTCAGHRLQLRWMLGTPAKEYRDDCVIDSSRSTYVCRNVAGTALVGQRKRGTSTVFEIGKDACDDFAGSRWEHRVVGKPARIYDFRPEAKNQTPTATLSPTWTCTGNHLHLKWSINGVTAEDSCAIGSAGDYYSCSNGGNKLVMGERYGARKRRTPLAPVSVHDPAAIVINNQLVVISTGPGLPVRYSPDGRNFHDREYPQDRRIFSQFKSLLLPWMVQQVDSDTDDGTMRFNSKALVYPHDTTVKKPMFEFAQKAPAIVKLNNQFLLFYSLGNFGTSRQSTGLLKTSAFDPTASRVLNTPAWSWTEAGPIFQTFSKTRPTPNYTAIDPAAFVDDDGKFYLGIGTHSPGIFITEANANGIPTYQEEPRNSKATFLAGEKALVSDVTESTGIPNGVNNVVEGAFFVKRGKYYYLFFATGDCCDVRSKLSYQMKVLRSEKIMGPNAGMPYLDRFSRRGDQDEGKGDPGNLLTTFENRVWGRGHGEYVKFRGKEYIVSHFYDDGRWRLIDKTTGAYVNDANGPVYEEGYFSRFTMSELLWDDKGWPLLGPAE